MASLSNTFNPRSKVKVQSAELTTMNMLQKLVEHGCIDLSPWIDPKGYSELPRHGGGYGDIYRGKMRDGCDIAVKVWRRFTDVDTSIAMKRCMREIYTWSKLKHENIHELLGVTQHLGQLGMVSVWMAYGDLWTYILNNPDVNRNPWCIQIATGILYLHTNETVHGDLKASNILLSSDLVAKISDFDSALVSDSSMTFSSTGELRNTLRWTAPELLSDSDDDDINVIQKTKKSDIYALAMTLLEIKTGQFPYAEYRDNNRVLRALLERRPPKRPKDIVEFSDGETLWDLLTRCWNHDPTARPGAQLVLQSLKVEIKLPNDKKRAQCNNHLPIQLIFDTLVNLTGADFSSKINPIQPTVMIANRAGFGDVWKGKLRNGCDIAIKAVRTSVFRSCNYRVLKRISHEIHHRSNLSHENINSFIGVILFKEENIGMISQWMDNGNLRDYRRSNFHYYDDHKMCVQITSGLGYMHHEGLVHGDIKATSVLVSADGTAKLTSFDFSSVLAREANPLLEETSNIYTAASNTRWMAPELFIHDVPMRTKQTDIYALGMTMIEIFTGEVPYPNCRTDEAVIAAVLQETLPNCPFEPTLLERHSHDMWQLMLSCWHREPTARPTAAEVLKSLHNIKPVSIGRT